MTAQFAYGGRDRVPGISAAIETFENEFVFGPWEAQFISGLTIDGASRDTGNTGSTHILRSGLLMGQVKSTMKLKPWDATAITGEETPWGVLKESRSMLSNNTNTDRLTGAIMIAGGLLSNRLIIPGQTALGLDADTTTEYGRLARSLLRSRFILNDDAHSGRNAYRFHTVSAAERAANITWDYADSHVEYYNTGGTLTIALAAKIPARGLEFRVHCITATTDNITVTSGSSNILTPGSAADASEVVSAGIRRIYGNGTNWVVETLS